MHYPNTPARLGDFPEQTIRLRDFDGTRRRKARLVLGLQESSGHVEFDLSTLRIGDPVPLWPVTNQTHRCAYSAPERRQPLRGVMSPSKRTPPDMTIDDFDTLQAWGATLIRYQMSSNTKDDGDMPEAEWFDRWVNPKLDHFDSFVLPQAVRRGMKVVLDLHEAPGRKNEFNEMKMFHDPALAEHFVETWRRIAIRFKGREGIYGYDLVNEPMQTSEAAPGCDFWTLQKRAAEAIREIDPDIPIVVEPIHAASPEGFKTLRAVPMKDVVYEVHVYQPFAYTHQGVNPKKPWEKGTWPDEEKGWNRDFLREKLAPVREFQLRHGARIYVGEFSAIAWADGAGEYLRDCISLFEEYGWDWTFHAFDEFEGWSIEHESDLPFEFRPSAENPRKQALLEGLGR